MTMGRMLRYAGGRRADGFKPLADLDDFERLHIASGRKLIKAWDDAPDLRDDPERWEALWAFYGADLLAAHIGRRPGSRPAAWYRFDFDRNAEPASGESEVEFLHRVGELEAGELEAIRIKALELVSYNGCGRRPERPIDNFIPGSDLHQFAARHGLLTAEERAVLRLDSSGRYQYAGAGAGKPMKSSEFT
jgi:hypothetical protein